MYLVEELKALEKAYPAFHFMVCLSREEALDGLDPAHMRLGRVNVSCDAFLSGKDPSEYEYYICGGKEAVEGMKQYVLEKGVPLPQVFAEKFTL